MSVHIGAAKGEISKSRKIYFLDLGIRNAFLRY